MKEKIKAKMDAAFNKFIEDAKLTDFQKELYLNIIRSAFNSGYLSGHVDNTIEYMKGLEEQL